MPGPARSAPTNRRGPLVWVCVGAVVLAAGLAQRTVFATWYTGWIVTHDFGFGCGFNGIAQLTAPGMPDEDKLAAELAGRGWVGWFALGCLAGAALLAAGAAVGRSRLAASLSALTAIAAAAAAVSTGAIRPPPVTAYSAESTWPVDYSTGLGLWATVVLAVVAAVAALGLRAALQRRRVPVERVPVERYQPPVVSSLPPRPAPPPISVSEPPTRPDPPRPDPAPEPPGLDSDQRTTVLRQGRTPGRVPPAPIRIRPEHRSRGDH
ncbi:hypothetical protein [Tsukamurella soli]|uniref:Uncharacterized protein n=1 Tax=Tsukamurella soli TaxID=644556 RepID=A0ABP8K5K3_9ACTN